MLVKPVLFLDLDGTVRYPKSGEFIDSTEDIAIFDGVVDVLSDYKDDGWAIAGVTNQGGVAFGEKTPEGAVAEVVRTNELCKNLFDTIRLCPMHPDGTVEPYNRRSLHRKPGYGMIADVVRDFYEHLEVVVDLDRSLMVGDRNEDQLCAEAAGIDFEWAWEFFGR